MYIEPPFPSMQFKQLTLILIQSSQPIVKKREEFQSKVNSYTPYGYSSLEYLFCKNKDNRSRDLEVG